MKYFYLYKNYFDLYYPFETSPAVSVSVLLGLTSSPVTEISAYINSYSNCVSVTIIGCVKSVGTVVVPIILPPYSILTLPLPAESLVISAKNDSVPSYLKLDIWPNVISAIISFAITSAVSVSNPDANGNPLTSFKFTFTLIGFVVNCKVGSNSNVDLYGSYPTLIKSGNPFLHTFIKSFKHVVISDSKTAAPDVLTSVLNLFIEFNTHWLVNAISGNLFGSFIISNICGVLAAIGPA